MPKRESTRRVTQRQSEDVTEDGMQIFRPGLSQQPRPQIISLRSLFEDPFYVYGLATTIPHVQHNELRHVHTQWQPSISG